MHRSLTLPASIAAALALAGLAAPARAGDALTLRFDNGGMENGITTPGTREFTFRGSSWSGGVVATEGILALYSSGAYSYEVDGDAARVEFDPPVDRARFFFVHGAGFPQGTATARDAGGEALATADSREATVFADPLNFVELDPGAPVAAIDFSGGVIDDFTYVPRMPSLPPPVEPGDLEIALEPVAEGLVAPVTLTEPDDGSGRLFVVDQTGVIRIIRDGELLETPFLDVRDRMVELNAGFDERGLLGLAFHPDFAENGRFFVRYSRPRDGGPDEPCSDPDAFISGCHTAVLSEFRVSEDDPDVADPASETVLFEADEPEFNHNAGHVTFGPDGYLYFSLGDGGGRDDGISSPDRPHGPMGNAQNLETPLGALHRIDVDNGAPFAVPPDNPFVDDEGALDTIYAYGFRNPYRFSFDRGGSNELFLADVGQDLIEEIDVVEAGGNYGWVIREGSVCFNVENPSVPDVGCASKGLIPPVAEYDHDEGLAVIGGFVYRGSEVPSLQGKYVFGDFSGPGGGTNGRLFWLDADGDRSRIVELSFAGRDALGMALLGLGEDRAGKIYVLASDATGPSGNGRVLRIAQPGAAPGRQVPGDCNQDGTFDISDGVCVLTTLFLGGGGGLPCGDGTAGATGNVTLLDWQDDGTLDISDAVAGLNFLFLGGPPHARSAAAGPDGCVPIPACPPGPGCD